MKERTKFVISILVIFIVWMALSFIVHHLLLGQDYAKLSTVFRPQMDAKNYFHYMLLAHALMSVAFVWIYLKGKAAGKPFWEQGIRYGVAIAVLTTIPTYLIYYVVLPLSGDLVIKQIVFDSMGVVILGVIVAALNR